MEDKTELVTDVYMTKEASYDAGVQKPEKTGTMLSGFSILAKSMIGVGMFAMAAGGYNFGIILGCVFVVLAGAITWLSLKVLATLAMDYSASNPSFYSVSGALMPKFKWVLDAALVINCFGGCIAYIAIAGSMMSSGFHGLINWDTETLSKDNLSLYIQLALLAVLAPLCMLKEISGTKIANLIGMLCIFYIVGLTFAFTPCSESSPDLLKPSHILKAFGSFPTFIFAFGCQQNAFVVANELKNPTQKKLDSMSFAAVATGMVIYLPLMILPLLTFGSGIKPIYLENLAKEHPDSTILMTGFIAAAISVSISYVLLMHPIRNSMMSLIFSGNPPTGRKEFIARTSLVAVLMAGTFFLAWVLGKKLNLPIDIAGLIGGNTMCFVMPFLLYLKKYGYSKTNKFSMCVVATLAFCIALYPICFSGIVYNAINS